MKPQNALFNWIVKKDAPGTIKRQLPRIIVTPPPVITKPAVQRKRRPRNVVPESTPSKLLLEPSFWTKNENDTPRVRKKRFLFQCRRTECSEQFSNAKNRDIHERHCLTFDEVLNSIFKK